MEELQADGTTTDAEATGLIIGVSGTQLLTATNGMCEGGMTTISAYDSATGTSTDLLVPSSDDPDVMGVNASRSSPCLGRRRGASCSTGHRARWRSRPHARLGDGQHSAEVIGPGGEHVVGQAVEHHPRPLRKLHVQLRRPPTRIATEDSE